MICTRSLSALGRKQYLHQLLRLAVSRRAVATFSSERKMVQRNRAALLDDTEQYDFLKEGIAEALADRMTDINRDFPTVVDLGAGKGHLYKHVNSFTTKQVVECDTAVACLDMPRQHVEDVTTTQVTLSAEDELPFDSNSKEIIVSNLWLHWVNDLPKLFKEVERVLVPDGVFLGAMFANESVYQLRVSLQQAELERTGGISPHISPFVTPQDLGSLLHSAGYCMITLDSEEVTIIYPDLYTLLRDLQGMGESNSLVNQPNMLRRDVLTGAAAIYHALFADKEDNSLPLSFNVLYFIGWKQSKLQGVPKPRGSQDASLQDLAKMMTQTHDKSRDSR